MKVYQIPGFDLQEHDVENESKSGDCQVYPTLHVDTTQSAPTFSSQKSTNTHHWTVSKLFAFFPIKNHLDAIIGPAKLATPWNP